ncbi:acylamino-acid-releasing enzyme-like isoform X2 [Solanum dulcamara]|uniref:acylamino-acid-releasing enzyme-like isoform X2 n=1 Tax=Solanum dulcamara TaxID=45834 RepID=UPI002485EEED|nr:acylamino-acid-releasing enzyme-like isoform X2 [Solanum dulcamara]
MFECSFYSFCSPRFNFYVQNELSYPKILSKPRRSLRKRRKVLNLVVLIATLQMENSGASLFKDTPVGLNEISEEEYFSQSTLLKEFTEIPTIEKAWTLKTNCGGSQVMFSISQPNLLENKKRRYASFSHISKERDDFVQFHWDAFPIEMGTASLMVPSPSGSKLLVVRNAENDSPTCFEIWSSSQVEREFHVPSSIHGSVYSDGWFEGISWNSDETLIAYIAEEPVSAKPTFTYFGYEKGDCPDKDCNSWKGQGDWEEGWGEAYDGKRLPKLFVINISSGEVRAVDGIEKSLSVGQVIWAPSSKNSIQNLVFVGWPSEMRKFGIKYCTNRPCSLYVVRAPCFRYEPRQSGPDGKFLVFLSSKSAVDSGAHNATDSLHRIDWSIDTESRSHNKIVDVVPVVMCAEDGSFPGLYCSNILSNPWLSDGRTMILSSAWGSTLFVLTVDILSGNVSRISPSTSEFSWDVLTLDGDNIIAVCSSPINVPEIKYGYLVENAYDNTKWNWLDISSPITKCSEKVRSLLSSKEFCTMPIPVRDASENLTKGASKPYEAIFASSKSKKHDACDPLIVVLHGGPQCVSLSSFSKSSAFLCSLGFSLLIVSYRGSLGFGEEAVQSLPGRVGSQDVNDVLASIDHVIGMGFADPDKIAAVGISHGGFLTTHLIGQAPDKFAAAAARNPVCNLALMVGTTDIPDWCYFEAFGSEAKSNFTAATSAEHLALLYNKSPISHISKVKTPTLMLLGAKDLRVPITDGLQYARALKEKGVEVKVMMFPDDIHELDRPRTDFESFLNIGVWFKKYCS